MILCIAKKNMILYSQEDHDSLYSQEEEEHDS